MYSTSKAVTNHIYTMHYVKNRLNIGVTVAADFKLSVLPHVLSHHNTHCYKATCCLHGCDDLHFWENNMDSGDCFLLWGTAAISK